MRYALVDVAKLPADQRIEALDREIRLAPGMSEADAGKAIDALLERLYAGTKLWRQGVPDLALRQVHGGLVATKDPMIRSPPRSTRCWRRTARRAASARARSSASARATRRRCSRRAAASSAPDANRTLRVTYGKVLGVPARDGLVYSPQTTLAGVVEKATGHGRVQRPEERARRRSRRCGPGRRRRTPTRSSATCR